MDKTLNMNHPTSMATPTMNISRADIDSLVREPSAAMRSRIIEKIADGYDTGLLSAAEVNLANEIFRLLVRDTERKVRSLLAQRLKSSMQVPHDIIWALANDMSHEIAAPVLQYSQVLTEEDLISIVMATREHPRLMAIASRDSISKELAHSLVETHDAKVTKKLLSNRSVTLADATVQTVLDEFSRDNSVLEELVYHGGLSHGFAEKLFSVVSDNMKKQLCKKYRLSKKLVDDSTETARETATLQFLSPWMSQQDINNLIEQMHRNGRLTNSVIVRSLCIGDLRFFETAIAKRVGIPPSNTRILMLDPGPLGFKALYQSSGLPENFYEAIRTMLQLAQQETEYGKYRVNDFGQLMAHRIRSNGYDESIENMDALLGMITIANKQPALH
jgi:uncharacterized protein (DUF2336 family)